MSINLHSIVRGAINTINADETVYLMQSAGQKNVKGQLIASYAAPEKITAQVQSLGGDDLNVINDTERTERDRKFYLFAKTATGAPPSGIIRPLGKTGDFIYRPADGCFWKIYNVSEDFSAAGWCLVLASQQVDAPAPLKAAIQALKESGEIT